MLTDSKPARSPRAAAVRTIAALADFQRATVSAAAAALGRAGTHGARFLVADEVGLGKTLVARGVIAALLKKHLRRPARGMFRVVYVCSNNALAQENVGKLAVFQGQERERWMQVPTFSRLAELGMRPPEQRKNERVLEICSLTPGTSLSFRNGPGNARERYIIWRALDREPTLHHLQGLEAFWRKEVSSSWEDADRWATNRQLDPAVLAEFSKRLSQRAKLHGRAAEAAAALELSVQTWRVLLRDYLNCRSRSGALGHLEAGLRSGLRELFAASCTASLHANLYVLDEFQRFAELLDGGAPEDDSETQMIARAVLHQTRAKTLLLSATPFKALTHVKDEQLGAAHSEQLSVLLAYLCHAHRGTLDGFTRWRRVVLQQLTSLPPPPIARGQIDTEARDKLQRLLRAFIARSERGILCADAEQVLAVPTEQGFLPLPGEIASFTALDRLGRAVHAAAENTIDAEMMGFHKAVPWSLSFMSGYKMKEWIERHRRHPEVRHALDAAQGEWIPYAAIDRFRTDLSSSPPSRRVQHLLDVAAPAGAEHMLWVPPSLPYYEGEGPFAGQEGFSKTLLFSSLLIAPRALSSLVSYECERRLEAKARGRSYFRDRTGDGGWFRFDGAAIAPSWGLLYPSRVLAAQQVWEQDRRLAGLRTALKAKLRPLLDTVVRKHGATAAVRSSRWYALAPFLLDATDDRYRASLGTWLNELDGISTPAMPVAVRSELQKVAQNKALQIGEPPPDLLDYLADLAIAGPAVCLWRAFACMHGSSPDHDIVRAATTAATAFVRKMNRVESVQVLKSVRPDMKPWTALASYAAAGNLQAVFDEYLHLLAGTAADPHQIAATFATALGSGAVAVTAQRGLSRRKENDVRFHCHYAVPLGNQKSSDEKGIARISHLRAAFNSPFWPFLLNSTSIGQEGLDFHWYCRRVVHWSLPSNPIDIEQREGRVNRYKSLVVRQRLARVHGPEMKFDKAADVWGRMFEIASSDRDRPNDLVPYWHVPKGKVPIERVVPMMAFSREQSRLKEILKVLALYRLAFGQPRQEDLLKNLLRREYSDDEIRMICNRLLVNLAPDMPARQGRGKLHKLPARTALRRRQATPARGRQLRATKPARRGGRSAG